MHDDIVQPWTVVLTGQDSGKLWLIHQILFEVAFSQEQPYLTTFNLQAVTGIEVALLPVGQFMQAITEKVMNPKVEALAAYASRQVAAFDVDSSVPEDTGGAVSITTTANYQGHRYTQVSRLATLSVLRPVCVYTVMIFPPHRLLPLRPLAGLLAVIAAMLQPPPSTVPLLSSHRSLVPPRPLSNVVLA